MEKSAVICLFFLSGLFFSFAAWSGDYHITISDDPMADCTKHARTIYDWCHNERQEGRVCRSDEDWPILSANVAAEDLALFLNRKKPKNQIIIAAFQNGHVSFCSAKEKNEVYMNLLKIRESVIEQQSLEYFLIITKPTQWSN